MTISQLFFRVQYTFKYLVFAKSNLYIHSPFAYDFYNKTLRGKSPTINPKILQEISALRKSDTTACRTAVTDKYGHLLNSLVINYSCKNVLELGTGLGVSSAYMASSGMCRVISIDKNAERQKVAHELHRRAQVDGNIQLVCDDIEHYLQHCKLQFDLVFIDANHESSALLYYFSLIQPLLSNNAIILVDDINWSRDMYHGWNSLRKDKMVRMSIELYRMGVLFTDELIKTKYHFMLKY